MDHPYARPQVASVAVARDWNPALLLMAVVFGMMVGLGLGLKDQLTRRGLDLDESYLVLASVLYGQEPTPGTATSLRQKLVSLDFASPAIQVLKLADRFSQSRDRERQREAEGLRLFGEALNTTVAPVVADRPVVADAVPSAVAATATSASQPTPVTTPNPTVAAIAPASGPSAEATPTQAPAAPPPPAPTATSPQATPPPASAAETGAATATIRSNDGKNLVLRREASSKSAKIVSMPNGSKVQIVNQVTGEAVEGQDNRWFLVKYKDLTGYAYAKYIQSGN